MVQLDDVPGDGQAQSQARALCRSLGLPQPLKYMRQKRRIDSLSLIGP